MPENNKSDIPCVNVRFIYNAAFLPNNYLAAGAGAGAGAASGAGAGAASGAGAGAASGAGASTAGASAGAVSSAFLQPTTARDNEATNSIATKIANIFFINREPPFKDLGTWFSTKSLY